MSKKIIPQLTVKQHGNYGVALSTNVAAVFHKRHDNVLQNIDKHIADLTEDGENPALYFQGRNYIGDDGKEHRSFEMTRLGFDWLVLSFNGKKARAYKLRFIKLFHAYEQVALKMQANKSNLEWQEVRTLGKKTHSHYTEQGKAFLEYAAIQRGNDDYAKHFYSNLAKAKLKAFFAFPLDVKPARDLLSPAQLQRVEMADRVADTALKHGMDDGLSHKKIYTKAVKAIQTVSELTGGVESVVIMQ